MTKWYLISEEDKKIVRTALGLHGDERALYALCSGINSTHVVPSDFKEGYKCPTCLTEFQADAELDMGVRYEP